MVEVSGNMLEEERPREYKRNSTEFKFVFKSYSGVVARTTDLVALMSSMFKMRTGTSDPRATESSLIPIECGWDKGNTKEHEKRATRTRRVVEQQLQKMGSQRCQWLASRREKLTEFEAVRRLRWWPQMWTKEQGGKRRRKLAWYGRWFHTDQTVLRALCDFRARVSEKFCHLRDFLSIKVWGMREVVYNEMNLHGEVFTVNVFAVFREGRRRQLLSMIWWGIEGFFFFF